jgi:predicted transcriptional regulator
MVNDMRRWLIGVVLALAVFGAVSVISYAGITYFYGEAHTITSTQTIVIEDWGEHVTIDNVQYEVTNAELAYDENFYQLNLISGGDAGKGYTAPPPAAMEVRYTTPQTTAAGFSVGTITQVSVPRIAYENAKTSGEPFTYVKTTETEPIDASPIAATIGVVMSMATLAVWAGYRHMWGGAASTLLEHGLHDMTVRDVEIVGYIMELREFTIPELMKMTKASKITVWRTVQKLLEKGLVEQAEKTKLAANGLGGRGKPSNIYRYVGAKSEQTKK